MLAIKYVALGAAGVLALLCVLSYYICTRFYRGSGLNKSIRKALKPEEDRPKEYTYHVLRMATDDFAENHVLGVGGFGKVYRGVLDGDSVAIKKFSPESTQGVDEYIAELKALGGQLKHRNLVKLKGFCHERTELLLVYEFVENGSLSSQLSGGRGLLDWRIRYRIAQDLAAALFFLHEKCTQCILHRDIKCDNVMLDSSFTAKLGDFGLARLVDHGRQSHMTEPAGTHGYIAPEYAITGKASRESDVYSFGIVLLEIASGRRVRQEIDGHDGLVDWVWQLYGARRLLEAADSKLAGDFDETQMQSVMIVGLWCAHPRDSERPLIHEAMQVLNGRASLPNLPRTKPMLGQPPLPFDIASSSHSLRGSFHSSSGTAFMTARSGFEGIGSDSSPSSTPLISSTQ